MRALIDSSPLSLSARRFGVVLPRSLAFVSLGAFSIGRTLLLFSSPDDDPSVALNTEEVANWADQVESEEQNEKAKKWVLELVAVTLVFLSLRHFGHWFQSFVQNNLKTLVIFRWSRWLNFFGSFQRKIQKKFQKSLVNDRKKNSCDLDVTWMCRHRVIWNFPCCFLISLVVAHEVHPDSMCKQNTLYVL